MAKHDFKLPDIGEGVVEGEIVDWHVSVGDTVSEDDPIVDVMTDKATVTIPSPVSGVVTSLSGEIGDMIAVGSVLVQFDGEISDSIDESLEVVEEVAEEESTDDKIIEVEVSKFPEIIKSDKKQSEEISKESVSRKPEINELKSVNGRILASPAVRRRAREAGIQLDSVRGSGPAGRVRHADLDVFIAAGGSITGAPPVSYSTKRTEVTEIKVVGLRRKIAEQMVKSATKIPHFSYFEEVDVTQLERLRQLLNSSKDESQVKLTYLPFIMLALSKIMPEHPECNALFYDDEGSVHRHSAVHLGIATQTERGLYVPVVKHVETMDIWNAASELLRVATSAREGSASLDDLTGSTFTITSLGREGGLGATPIINHPEVAILGIHKAREMPVVESGNIVIRRIMNLSSSFDHRVVDGADGARLIQHLKRVLENPALIFM